MERNSIMAYAGISGLVILMILSTYGEAIFNRNVTVNGTLFVNGTLNVSGNITGISTGCIGYHVNEVDNGTHLYYNYSGIQWVVVECED